MVRMVPSGSGMMEKMALVAADAKNEADSKQKNCHDVGGASSAAASGATTSTAAMASRARRAVITTDTLCALNTCGLAVTKPAERTPQNVVVGLHTPIIFHANTRRRLDIAIPPVRALSNRVQRYPERYTRTNINHMPGVVS